MRHTPNQTGGDETLEKSSVGFALGSLSREELGVFKSLISAGSSTYGRRFIEKPSRSYLKFTRLVSFDEVAAAKLRTGEYILKTTCLSNVSLVSFCSSSFPPCRYTHCFINNGGERVHNVSRAFDLRWMRN